MTYESLGQQIGALVDSKATSYGNSFERTAAYLKVLWPDGIQPDQYAHLGLLVRIFDKTMRIATGHYEDSYRDIAGYALLGEKITSSSFYADASPEPAVEVIDPDYWTFDPETETWTAHDLTNERPGGSL